MKQVPDEEQEAAPVTRPKRPTYKQDWPAYNAAQTNEKTVFQSLLSALCQGVEEPVQTLGRPRLPLADMIFSAAFKIYSTVSTRRFICDLQDAYAKGYLSRVPHYNSIFNYLEDASLTPILRDLIKESSLCFKSVEVDFAVDSSGFSTANFVRWYNARYGKEQDNHDWMKVHLMCGVKTNVVTSVEITGRFSNDSPQFTPLVKTTARNFTIREVGADKAYSSRGNLELVKSIGGTPYVPFKSNSLPTGESELWEKMWLYFQMYREDFLTHYHKRSNVESTMSMIKAKFGEHIRSKTDTAIVNELLCKVLCHNVCVLISAMYELGIEPTFWAKTPLAQKVTG